MFQWPHLARFDVDDLSLVGPTPTSEGEVRIDILSRVQEGTVCVWVLDLSDNLAARVVVLA